MLPLLRARRERHCRCAGEKAYKLAPPHEHLAQADLLWAEVKHERCAYAIPWRRPQFSFRFLPLPASVMAVLGRARDTLGPITRIVGQPIPASSTPAELLIRSPRRRGRGASAGS